MADHFDFFYGPGDLAEQAIPDRQEVREPRLDLRQRDFRGFPHAHDPRDVFGAGP